MPNHNTNGNNATGIIPRESYDMIIIGAGPAGLATLSAIQDPYSLDTLSADQAHRANRHLTPECRGSSVLVVDPHPTWMAGWKSNFKTLDIQFLRSPALAHPDQFDQNALLAFAQLQGRSKELIESGCGDVKSLIPLGQSQVGLWALPSVKLFHDFCQQLAQRLPHDYLQGSVTDIQKEEEGGSAPLFQVQLADGSCVKSTAVVLAMGTVGRPIVPRALAQVPPSRIIQWTQLGSRLNPHWKKALVIGGGLTALQAAQRLAKHGNLQITLCSRRPLAERHFDLSMDWFDRRTATKCMSDFYHLSHENRLALLKQSRGGGSIPGIYMQALRELEAQGRIRRLVGTAVVASTLDDESNDDGVDIMIRAEKDGQTIAHQKFDIIVLACGIQPDCETNPLCQKLLERWPLQVQGGFPCLSEDLEWTPRFHVVGGLGSLSIGPDAANLMGARRAAQIVANSLECRCWLREENVLKNPFDALMWTSSDDDSASDEED